jgi:phospholipid/cholesterol/gamma-HCH transport system substrate-binding protein
MAHYTRGHSELTVGALLIAAVIVLAGLFLVMTDNRLERQRTELHVAMPSASGLVKGDAVFYRGVVVGEVRSLDYLSRSDAVVVRLRLKHRVPLKQDATATLTAVDLFGRQSIVLDAGTADELPIASGDTIVGFSPPALTGRVEGLSMRAEAFLSDSTLNLLRGVLGGTQLVLHDVGATVRRTDRVISSQTGRVEAALEQVIRLSSNLANATDSLEVRRIQANLEQASANLVRLTEHMDSTSASLDRVLAKLERGNGSAARFLNDPLFYENATAAFARLDELLLDIKRNPKRYVSVRIF